MEEKLNLAIEGMHCGGCVRRVTGALGSLAGVRVGSVEVGSADVAFNPKQISPEQIRNAVEKIGFSVRAAGVKDV